MQLIVFGSAVKQKNPRDIDVLTGTKCLDRYQKRAVRAWAAKRGISRAVPIDHHAGYPSCLPLACGKRPDYVVLQGTEPTDNEFWDYNGIASILRCYGFDTAAVIAAIIKISSWIEVSLSPTPSRVEPWSEYTQGVTALRSAARHCDFEAICNGLGDFGLFLRHVVEADIRPTASDRKMLHLGSPYNTDIEIVGVYQDGIWWFGTEYGHGMHSITHQYCAEVPMRYESLAKILWP